METIKKYLPYIAICLFILLVFAIVQVFQMNNEIKALKRSESIIQEQLEEIKESNFNAIYSLQEVINSRNLVIQELELENIALQEEETDINTQSNENKTRIIGITDADSLERHIARRYD